MDLSGAIDDRRAIARRPHFARTGRMVGAFAMGAHESVDRIITDHLGTGREFVDADLVEGRLGENLAR